MKIVTQADIAQKLGISQPTVGYAIHNYRNPRMSVRPEMRERILETARQMGYVPHAAGRRLASTRAASRSTSFDQIGLIAVTPATPDVDWVRHAMMDGAEHELSQHHACIFFVRIGEESDWEKVERMTRAGGVDGWLLYGAVTDAVVNRLKTHALGEIPFVVLGEYRCAQPVHSVDLDNEAVGRLAVQHLASLGHRRIGLLDNARRFTYQDEMHAGFSAALKEMKLDNDERLILRDSSLWSQPGRERLLQWLRIDPKPTAVFVPEVDWAATLWDVLKESQIEVPHDISVLTCDPISIGAKLRGLTRIELPMNEVGRSGAALLHRLATHQATGDAKTKISPLLIDGTSTGAPSNPA